MRGEGHENPRPHFTHKLWHCRITTKVIETKQYFQHTLTAKRSFTLKQSYHLNWHKQKSNRLSTICWKVIITAAMHFVEPQDFAKVLTVITNLSMPNFVTQWSIHLFKQAKSSAFISFVNEPSCETRLIIMLARTDEKNHSLFS